MNDNTLPGQEKRDGEYATEVEQFLGNYRLVRVIGGGAMGTVYLASHRKFAQREYAIKLIRPDIVTEATRQRFEREITAMGGLVHPNLVYASDAGVDESDRMYLVMEYVRGKDLQKHIDSDGPFKIPQAIEILCQICAGVAHAHKQGVVHRDIKPSNVLLSDSLNVKVLDLGIASLQSEASSRITSAASVMGTAAFIAPELWDDASRASPASDVYAIACTAYCLCVGSPPFAGEAHRSLVQMMTAHRRTEPVPLHEQRADVPAELSAIILRALHKDPTRRYQNAEEFANHIASFAEPLSADVGLFVGESKPSSPRGTTTRIGAESGASMGAVSFGLIVLLVGVLSLYMAYQSDASTPAWHYVFGQLENEQNSTQLGLGIDALRILFVVPATFLVLASFYRTEVRRTLLRWEWSTSVIATRIACVTVFAAISYLSWLWFWEIDGLPSYLSEIDQSDTSANAARESLPSRWYFAYAIVTRALMACLTVVFPVGWFLANDIPSFRNRYFELMAQQDASSFPGELRENLHRFGSALRVRAGRLLAMLAIAVMLLQYNYWINVTIAVGVQQLADLKTWRWISLGVGAMVVSMMVVVAICYFRAYGVTNRRIAAVGSARDEEELEEISVQWLVQTIMVRRFSGLVCLSLLLLLGHSAWSMSRPREFSRAPQITAPSASWIPDGCLPAPNARLVAVEVRGFTERLYSEIRLGINDSGIASKAGVKATEKVTSIPFVLVPQTNVTAPPSFYIMKHKVSQQLFSQFADAYPNLLNPKAVAIREQAEPEQESGPADPDLPVMNVTAIEAIEFAAVVCHGVLPTPEQWDNAFGRYYDATEAGRTITYLPRVENDSAADNLQPWPDGDKLLVGLSPWGCLQMGNDGLEYTRYDVVKGQIFVSHDDASLALRGWSDSSRPLTVDSWKKLSEGLTTVMFFGRRPPNSPSDDVGFRVVIEQGN